jgi:GTP:adenosylcobinamide-phosphate guanylyltransferase
MNAVHPLPVVAAIVLAAGQSRRMGACNKLLLPIDGVPMIRRVVDNVVASRADPVVVVTGFEPERVENALSDCGVRLVHNPLYEQGMGYLPRLRFSCSDDTDRRRPRLSRGHAVRNSLDDGQID